MDEDTVSSVETTTYALRERLVVSLRATLGPMLRPHTSADLYALAVTTDSDVLTVRVAAHTEEALGELLAEHGELAADEADYYRWWPDEWRISDDGIVPDGGAETTVSISRAMFDAALAPAKSPDPYGSWRDTARAALEAALDDARVRARIAELNPGWHPVLFVTDTDGDAIRTVQSLDALNPGHPAPHLVASAHTYFNAD